jgi:hypothetical protein
MASDGVAELVLGAGCPLLPRPLPENLAEAQAEVAAVARGLAQVRLGLGLLIVPHGLGVRQADAPTHVGISNACYRAAG